MCSNIINEWRLILALTILFWSIYFLVNSLTILLYTSITNIRYEMWN